MKFLGILLLLLITTVSVLCRHISHRDLEDMTERVFSSLPNTTEVKMQNTTDNLERKSIDSITPRAEISEGSTDITVMPDPVGNTSFDPEGKFEAPISKKRIQKMLKKAIVQIITGDLTNADMSLLKSLNYDAEQVRRIREEEFKKMKNNPDTKNHKSRAWDTGYQRSRLEHDSEDTIRESQPVDNGSYDYEDFNNQATIDYEYAASNFEARNGSWGDLHSEFDERMRSSTEILPENEDSSRPNIIFTINYNDSEFDSSSEEHPKLSSQENHQSVLINGTGNNFPAAVTSVNSSSAPVDDEIETLSELWIISKNYFSTTENTIVEDNEIDSQSRNQNEDLKFPVNTTEQPEGRSRFEDDEEPFDGKTDQSEVTPRVAVPSPSTETPNVTNNSANGENRTNLSTKYKGLRWVQDNVYQVIPEYIDSLQTDVENETSVSEDDDASYQNLDDVILKNPTITEDLDSDKGMMSDAPDPTNDDTAMDSFANLTAYRQMLASQRIAQRQKTEDEIKSRVLLVTGRLNSTNNSNPLQPRREKLTMFSPTCGIPRNTDAELWQDPYSMNMQFQLNLTFDQHLVAARLRIYKLPQENSTATATTSVDGMDSDEKKIRISVYYYTRSLKKHRSIRKRLIDSKVSSLTATGEHLALDVKDAAIHWRSSTRNSNHGLLVLVEDQEGRPLQPSHYVQTPNCQNPADPELQDEKAYQRFPALFVGACTRYVRLVGNRTMTYEFWGTEPEQVPFRQESSQY